MPVQEIPRRKDLPVLHRGVIGGDGGKVPHVRLVSTLGGAGNSMLDTFGWTTFDVTWILPDGWQRDAMHSADEAEVRPFGRTPLISREADDVQQVVRGRVHADQVASEMPWLRELYRTAFRELGEQATGRKVHAAADERYGTVLNVQRGPRMRFECHVDSNPLTGLLFCTGPRARRRRRAGFRSR